MRRETDASREPLLSRPVPAMLYGLAALLLLCAAVRSTLRAHADRELLETGEARWIWYTKELRQPVPLAFFATRDFLLEKVPPRATAKVFVDRRHVLFVNGVRAGTGAQRPADPLLLWDLRPLLRVGVNRLAIEAQSANGVGGILFALDLAGAGRNAVVSDGRWRVDLSADALRRGARFRAEVWGRPPMYPWGYPRMPRPNEIPGSKIQVPGLVFGPEIGRGGKSSLLTQLSPEGRGGKPYVCAATSRSSASRAAAQKGFEPS